MSMEPNAWREVLRNRLESIDTFFGGCLYSSENPATANTMTEHAMEQISPAIPAKGLAFSAAASWKGSIENEPERGNLSHNGAQVLKPAFHAYTEVFSA